MQPEVKFQIRKNEAISLEIVRILTELYDYTIFQLRNSKEDIHIRIHETRKCFKKIRAILRMVQFEIGDELYNLHDKEIQQMGRILSEFRDSTVFIETWDIISKHKDIPSNIRTSIHLKLLYARTKKCAILKKKNNPLIQLKNKLGQNKSDVISLPIVYNDISLYIEGINSIYLQGLQEMEAAKKFPSSENIHSWRKREKYLMYELEIMHPLLPEWVSKSLDKFDELADILGTEHDMAELIGLLLSAHHYIPDSRELALVIATLQTERKKLQKNAWRLGKQLYSKLRDILPSTS